MCLRVCVCTCAGRVHQCHEREGHRGQAEGRDGGVGRPHAHLRPLQDAGGAATEGDGHSGEDLPDGGQPDGAGFSAEQQVQGEGWGKDEIRCVK